METEVQRPEEAGTEGDDEDALTDREEGGPTATDEPADDEGATTGRDSGFDSHE